MKNFATRLITLLCVFCLIFTFVSCQKDDNKKGKDEDVKGEEVTKDEWTAAFDLSNVENMEIKITENFSELDKENNEKYQESLSIDAVYKNGTVSFEVTEKEDGETDYYGPYEEDVFGNTLWGIFDAIGDISFSDLTEIVHPSIHTPPSLESCSNFYSYFEYSEKEGYYSAIFETHDYDSINLKIWFVNSKISKMTLECSDSDSDYQYEMYSSCIFE